MLQKLAGVGLEVFYDVWNLFHGKDNNLVFFWPQSLLLIYVI